MADFEKQAYHIEKVDVLSIDRNADESSNEEDSAINVDYEADDNSDTDLSIVSCASQASNIKSGKKNEPFFSREIKTTEENIEALDKDLLHSNERINEILELVKRRENIDENINQEKSYIENILNNENIPETLRESAKEANEKINEMIELSKKNETTIKSPIDILSETLKVFRSACTKSLDKVDLKYDSNKEFLQYKDYQNKVKDCIEDVTERNEFVAKAEDHLAKCIQLSKEDVVDITDKRKKEIADDRSEKFKETKLEVDNMIQSEMHDVQKWLKNCDSDLKKLEFLRENQNKLYPSVESRYEENVENLTVEWEINKKEQATLLQQLKQKKDEEKKINMAIRQNKNQYKDFERAHEQFMQISSQLLNDISGIQSCANTLTKIIGNVSESSNILLDSSMQAETKFQDELRRLEIESKERYLQVLLTSAVDKRVLISYAVEKYDLCKQKAKSLKVELQNAVRKGIKVIADDTRERLGKFANEIKIAEQEKVELEDSLKTLTEDIDKISKNLKEMGVDCHETLDSMYETRLKEEQEFNELAAENMFSLC